MDLAKYIKNRKRLIDRALDLYLPKEDEHPRAVHKAMRYSVFSGGKRIRSILAIVSCEVCGGKTLDILPTACGIELVHAYSLIHDDLPAMDNDDYRRGKPSCHKKFNEAVAILAGDALLTYGLYLMTKKGRLNTRVKVIQEVTKAIGTQGMIGGQVVDSQYRNKKADISTLEYIHTHKTGALITVALKVGAMISGAERKDISAITQFGEYIGLTFQIIDDILDGDGYSSLFGDKRASQEAERLVNLAKGKLDRFGARSNRLRELADFILHMKK